MATPYRNIRFNFTGQVVLVTGVGSDSGIGRAILRRFAEAGALLAGVDIDASGIERVRAEFPAGLFATLDTRDEAAVAAFVDATIARFGKVDVLVNNAGVAPFSRLLDLSVEDWDRTFEVNVRGYFLFARAVGRHMRERGQGGNIVNVTSISVHVSGEMKAHYAASKAAIGSLTKGMAIEFARHNIRVNSVEPGTIDTAITAQQPAIQALVEAGRRSPGFPINRYGIGDDVAGAALFVCSDAANYMTGGAILIDGGDLAGSQLAN